MTTSNGALEAVFSKIIESDHSAAFIPICLYSRNLLRVPQVRNLIQIINVTDIKACFVVADYLHGLNMMLRGYRSETSKRKADVAGQNLVKMVKKITASEEAHKVEVLRWEEVAVRPSFGVLLDNIEKSFATTKALADLAEQFVQFQKGRTEWELDEQATKIERHYLCSEIAMSVYMTEMAGHCCELWEEPPTPGGPDPLGEIYRCYPQHLREWTGRSTPCRTLYRLPATW
jgi:tRNA-dependent cyclodipeptide synthase